MLVLGFETSCDETGVGVVRDGKVILSDVLASSAELHSKYGGIVPEIASRRQIAVILPVLKESLSRAGKGLEDIDGIAVTKGPGLIGSLLVGLNVAKAIAFSRRIPFVGVSHLEGHLWAIFLEERSVTIPFLGLLISGGHTAIYHVHGIGKFSVVGSTRDDAAGEAFDKVAWALGLGYPGGPIIDTYSREGDPCAFRFPRARIRGNSLDFSFSGIKTSVVQFIEERRKKRKGKLSSKETRDICASFQEAVVDMLLDKTFRAVEGLNIRTIVICGGVAANSRIRARFLEQARRDKARIYFPSPNLCTDNGAMIAGIGFHYLKAGRYDDLDMDAHGS